MSEKAPVVITKKQAKRQINHFGRSLLIYVSLSVLVKYALIYTERYFPEVLAGVDADLAYLYASMILLVFVTLIPFSISALFLHLDIKDYLRNPKLRIDRIIALICIGIGLNLLVTSISTLFYFFFHTQSAEYPYLGDFSTNDMIIKNLVYVAYFVIVKPICDAYIFRGIIQRQLGHYGRYFGVLGSAFLYMIAQANLVDAFPAFVIGWYLSLITLRYHSIRPSITVHIVLSLFLWGINVIPGNYLWLVTLFIVLIYIFAGLFLFQKRVDTGMVRYGATEWKLWKILLTSWTIAVCIIIFIVNVVLSLQF